LRLAVGVGISAAAVLLLTRTVDVPATAGRLSSINPWWLVVPLAAIATQLSIRAVRWSILLTATTRTAVQPTRVVGPLVVGYLANAVLPARLGEVARAVLVARREHLPIAEVAASIVVERVIDLSALLTIGLLSTGVLAAVGGTAQAATAALVATIVALALSARWLASHLPRRLPGRLRTVVGQFLVGISGVGPRPLLSAYALSAVAWMGDVALVWACGQALDVGLSLPAAIAIAVGAALGTALPAASGYLGTYELGAVTIGSLAGTAPDTILAIAVVAHVLAVVPIALLGIVAVIRMGVRFQWSDPHGAAEAAAARPARQ
jgi:hypothetical protein